MAKYVLIGGGEDGGHNSTYNMEPFDREIIRLSGKTNPNFLFIGFASKDTAQDFRITRNYRMMYHCHTDQLTLEDCKNRELVQAKLDWADIIYVGGGYTQMLMKRLRRFGIDEMLLRAATADKVLCGISAGAICWCSWGQCGGKPETAQKVKALGHLPMVFCPHILTQPQRAVFLKKLMRSTYRIPAVALDNAALVIDGEQVRLITLAENAQAVKCFWKQGEYLTCSIPEYKNISVHKLLEK